MLSCHLPPPSRPVSLRNIPALFQELVTPGISSL
jgi:hypothetical protein